MIKTIEIGTFFFYLLANKKKLLVFLFLLNSIASLFVFNFEKNYQLKAYYYINFVNLGDDSIVFWNKDRDLLKMLLNDLNNYSKELRVDVGKANDVEVIDDHRSDKIEVRIQFNSNKNLSERYYSELNSIRVFLNDKYIDRIEARLLKLKTVSSEGGKTYNKETELLNDRLFFLELDGNDYFGVEASEIVSEVKPNLLLVLFWVNIYASLLWLVVCYFRVAVSVEPLDE